MENLLANINGVRQLLSSQSIKIDEDTTLDSWAESINEDLAAIKLLNRRSLFVSEADEDWQKTQDLFVTIKRKLQQGWKVIDCRRFTQTNFTVSAVKMQEDGFDTELPWKHHDGNPAKAILIIDRPCEIYLPQGEIRVSNTANGESAIGVASNNVEIHGFSRLQNINDTESRGFTHLIMETPFTIPHYHIYGCDVNSFKVDNLTLKGLARTNVTVSGGTNSGVGGIYLMKRNPGGSASGNNNNNLVFENILINGSYHAAFYIGTPILCILRNLRVSNAGGHGIFINNGTSVMIENCFVAQTYGCGFVLSSVSYSTLMNCASEMNYTGYWLRSCNSITMLGCGAEETSYLDRNVKHSFNLSEYGYSETAAEIKDSNTESEYTGCYICIAGGSCIHVQNGYGNNLGDVEQADFAPIVLKNNASNVFIVYPRFKYTTTKIENKNISMRTWIRIYATRGCTIYVDLDSPDALFNWMKTNKAIFSGWTEGQYITTSTGGKAHVYYKAEDDQYIEIHSGKKWYLKDGVYDIRNAVIASNE